MSNTLNRVAFHTLGCKVNFSETASISREFINEGYIVVDFSNQADVYVLNTCTVTDNADRKSRKFIREIIVFTLKNSLPKGVCLNVNIPKSKDGEIIKGIRVCRQADGNWIEDFQENIDEKGELSYLMAGKFINYDEGKDTDEWALANPFISIVPVKFDVTSHESIIELQKLQS